MKELLNFDVMSASINSTSLFSFFLSVTVSVVFAYVFKLIYHMYTDGGSSGGGVSRSFLIIAPAVTSIFLVIQFSLPLSLGLLGALSFVRFRTPIKEPEEIGFILVVIASSLSCAVFRYEVGIILAVVLLVVTFLKKALGEQNFLLNPKRSYDIFITSNKNVPVDCALSEKIIKTLNGKTSAANIVSASESEGQISYHVRVLDSKSKLSFADEVIRSLKAIQHVSQVNLIYNER